VRAKPNGRATRPRSTDISCSICLGICGKPVIMPSCARYSSTPHGWSESFRPPASPRL